MKSKNRLRWSSRWNVAVVLAGILLLLAFTAWSQEGDYLDSYIGADADLAGDENCLMCHPDRGMDDGKSHVAVFADETSPLHGSGCEACHGPGGNHNGLADGIMNPAKLSPAQGNALCTRCHEPEGEFHNVVGGACLDCHSGHAANVSYLIAKEAAGTEERTVYMDEYIGSGSDSMGNDNCLMCHPDFNTDGKLNHAAYFTCETCHGPGGSHMGVAMGILNPKKMPVEDSNTTCTMCHQPRGEFHELYPNSCVDCHSGHSETESFLTAGEVIEPEPISLPGETGVPYYKAYTGADAQRMGDEYCSICHIDKLRITGFSHVSIFKKEGGPLYNKGCEICHGPGSKHIGNTNAILHPERMPKSLSKSLCTMCHIPQCEFHKAVGDDCLNCHSAHAESSRFLSPCPAFAAEERADYMAEYIGEGADSVGNDMCIMCHPDSDPADEAHHSSVLDCEACHGPGGNHNGVAMGILNPAKMPVEDTNFLCTMCHEARGDFHGVFAGSCTDCHSGHSGNVSYLKTTVIDEEEVIEITPPVEEGVPYIETYIGAGAERWGSEFCLMCHADYAPTSAFTHVSLIDGDSGNPDFGFGCEGCHGPGGKHMGVAAGILMPTKLTSEETTELCSECHSDLRTYNLQGWYQSEHFASDLSCLDCHGGHSSMEKYLVGARDDFCNSCHTDMNALFGMRSHHPVKEGKLTCLDCHNMHSGAYENQLNVDRDELCFGCHPDKQGPFIYDHDVSMASGGDGCLSCHLAHGSNSDSLLRLPQQLCNQCHTDQTPARHFPGNCWTSGCHTEIHGSNAHPLFFY